MDDRRFDAFTKSIATKASRRSFLKAAIGAGAGTVASFVGLGAAAAPAGKVTICHVTHSKTNPFVLITVSQNALPAHMAHGDYIVDPTTDPDNCGDCGVECRSINDPCFKRACIAGKCAIVPNPGAPCEDGDLCTTRDTCNADGVCVPGVFTACFSTDPCIVNVCNPDTGDCEPTNAPAGKPCDDSNACTSEDQCDGAGHCVGTPVSCDDGDDCTIDSCDPATGECVHEEVICPGLGEICAGGVCTTCEGATCDFIVPGCDPTDPGCFCFDTVEGTGFCHCDEPCAGLQTCTSSAECPADHPACAVTCCGEQAVCVRPCSAAGGTCVFPGLAVASVDSGPTTTGRG